MRKIASGPFLTFRLAPGISAHGARPEVSNQMADGG
jgi:hypothetical protein